MNETTSTEVADRVAEWATAHFEKTIEHLCTYLRVPAISCDAAHHADVARLAEMIRSDLAKLGFEANVRTVDGALPLVSAERKSTHEGHPTVLIYGHLDLQPVKGEAWSSPPHEPRREGDRLYARGAADDMGGWVSHLAALEAWLAVSGDLPINVKLVIEGEEEIGSPNLARYMDAFPSDFEADVMVLTDCENPSTEIPGLTTSLRGLYEVEVVCEALESDVHSGIWGNMAPDVGNALIKLLARLTDDDGRPVFGLAVVPEAWREAAYDVPLTSEVIKSGAHLLSDVEPLPTRGRPPAEWIWRQPAVTILSTTLPRPDEHKNALRRRASATLSVRVPPGKTHQEMRAALDQLLLVNAPGGVRVRLQDRPGRAESWLYSPQGPAFEAADRAYQKAWGRPLLQIGIGGSIPFVALFGKRYSHLPLILNGVMDPETGAHGPDESLHLGVFRKAVRANVFLLDELARLPRG
jgi:acetylornithine deacetylase/succinyl-diaminopimelate desuccinylase-like protein